jgi:hypothetical protein
MAFPLAFPYPAVSLFHDPNGTAFADLEIDSHRETWPIRSRQFRHWLRRRHYKETGSAASAETIRSAVDLLEARAQFDAPERTVHIRVAEHDGRTYVDLADKDWRAVQIGPHGWQVVTSPPVWFRRAAGMLPLPIPQRGGSIEALAAFLNLPGPDEFVLVVAWLLAALQPGRPYPLLAIAGEQGSAKTVVTKILLIDPNVAPTRVARPALGECGDVLGQPIDVEDMGIEVVREPFFEFAMALVVGIGDGLEEFGIAPGTADVLGRAAALGFEIDQAFDLDGVFPSRRQRRLVELVSRALAQLRIFARERRLPFSVSRNVSISAEAVRRRRPSRPGGPTSCAPSGRPPSPANSGSDKAGKPLKVHKVQNVGSPVEPSPFGATPGAAGVTIAS